MGCYTPYSILRSRPRRRGGGGRSSATHINADLRTVGGLIMPYKSHEFLNIAYTLSRKVEYNVCSMLEFEQTFKTYPGERLLCLELAAFLRLKRLPI